MAISAPVTIDGVTYPHIHVTSIKRNFQVLDGDNAGRVMSGAMVRDVIGTYYNYSISIDADGNWPQEYDRLYDVITSPVDSHTIIVPYAQTTLAFRAYVTNGSDDLKYMANTLNRWGGLSFNFIAMEPQRT